MSSERGHLIEVLESGGSIKCKPKSKISLESTRVFGTAPPVSSHAHYSDAIRRSRTLILMISNHPSIRVPKNRLVTSEDPKSSGILGVCVDDVGTSMNRKGVVRRRESHRRSSELSYSIRCVGYRVGEYICFMHIYV